MSRPKEILSAIFLFTVCLGSHAQQAQTFLLNSTQDLEQRDVKASAVEYKGRNAVRVDVVGQEPRLALLRGTQFGDGIVEADVAVKVTTPPNIRNPGFIGIAFRAQPDGGHYELFYIRPGNSGSADQAQRNHSVQYAAKPEFDWYRLRRPWPSVYEAYADLQPEAWTHIKIEVEGRRAKLYVNGAQNPVLVVDGLKGEDLKGAVGLWASSGQENYFSNVRIGHAKRQSIQNGGEAAGTWEVQYATDAGNYSGLLKLRRDGGSVSGTASGPLGSDVPLSGTWRNGYLEIAFRGTWSGFGSDPGETAASLAGWIDGNSAKGRVSVTGRADGVWTATRKE